MKIEECEHFTTESIMKELNEIYENDPDSIYDYYDVVYDREIRICSDCDYLEYCTLPAIGNAGIVIEENKETYNEKI